MIDVTPHIRVPIQSTLRYPTPLRPAPPRPTPPRAATRTVLIPAPRQDKRGLIESVRHDAYHKMTRVGPGGGGGGGGGTR